MSNNNSKSNNDSSSAAAAADAYVGGTSEIIEIIEEEDENVYITSSSTSSSSSQQNKNISINMSTTGKSRSQQLTRISEGDIENNTTSLFSIDIHSGRSSDDVVYVAVGKSESSMDALLWTLNHFVNPGSTLVYLIHIFSEVRFIPSPFGGGLVPKSQVRRDTVESYLAEDTRKRRELLNKYVDICTSHLVQVETIVIESDFVANAILELIEVLNIRQLVVGISKSNLRKLKAGKGSATITDQIRQRAKEQGCELTIICQGKQLTTSELYGVVGDNLHLRSSSVSLSPTSAYSGGQPQFDELLLQLQKQQRQQEHEHEQPTSNSSFSCCFRG